MDQFTAAGQPRREINVTMVARIRQDSPRPYQEGRPVARVIVVPCRRTGLPRRFPISVNQFDGRLYLCSSSRDVDWARNLLAAGSGHVEGDEPAERFPVLADGDETAEVIAKYLPVAGFEPDDLPYAIGAPVEEIRPHTARVAVFRLDPQ